MAIQPAGGALTNRVDVAQKNIAIAETSATARAAAAQAAAAAEQSSAPPTPAQLEGAVRNINKVVQAQAPNLEFSVDTDNDRTIVKVVDQETREVLRQIPSEEALNISKALDRLTGLLIRQKA